MADTTIQKQGEVFISQSEYDALRLAGNLQSNTKYHITKTPETATEDFVNNGFVAKITPPDQFVYVYGYSENTPVLLKATSSATANQLAYRGTGGVLSVGKPTADNHATPKSYVDGLHHYSHHIQITDGTSEIFITLAIKNHPNPVTTLDGVTELVFALTEQVGEVPIMATGVVDGHNVHAVLVQSDRHLYAKYYDSTKNMILTDKVQVLLPGIIQVNDIVA